MDTYVLGWNIQYPTRNIQQNIGKDLDIGFECWILDIQLDDD